MARFHPPTFLESFFFLAAVAMAVFAVAPTVRQSRNAARIDLAARSLVDCDRAVRHLLRTRVVTNADDITLEMIERDRRAAKRPVPVWPDSADLASFRAGTNGATIRVVLLDGSSVLVTTESNLVEHAN